MDASIDHTSCNVKAFYGKKKPPSNLRWFSKKNAFHNNKHSTTNCCMNISPIKLKHTIPAKKTSKRKVMQNTNTKKEERCSMKKMPKRLCKREDICYSSLKNKKVEPKKVINKNVDKKSENIDKETAVSLKLNTKVSAVNKEVDVVHSETSMSNSVDTINSNSPLLSTSSYSLEINNVSLSCNTKHDDVEITEQNSQLIDADIVKITSVNVEETLKADIPNILKESSVDSEKTDDDTEDYEMFNCDGPDTSYGSHSNILNTSISSKKKPHKKTILNYFSKIDTVKNYSSNSWDRTTDKDIKSLKNTQQLHFSKKGLSPKSIKKNEENHLFDLATSSKKSPQKNKRKNMKNKTNMEQMYIDIGQKDFGHVKCDTCGMVYTKCQEEDEAQHAKYHQKIVHKLKFNGWKCERVVEQFHDGRIIAVHNNDNFMHLKKLSEIREVVDSELGFAKSSNSHFDEVEQAFLFISSKKVIGCVIAVSIKKAYPVLISEPSANDQIKDEDKTQSWCCSSDAVKAVCGISRVWVFSKNRRQKIATRLVDCVRHHFLYGCVIDKSNLAFSDPTPNGRVFAETYVGKKEILVFR